MNLQHIELLDRLRLRGGVTFAHVSPQYRDLLRKWSERVPPLVTITDNRATITAAGIAEIERGAKR